MLLGRLFDSNNCLVLDTCGGVINRRRQADSTQPEWFGSLVVDPGLNPPERGTYFLRVDNGCEGNVAVENCEPSVGGTTLATFVGRGRLAKRYACCDLLVDAGRNRTCRSPRIGGNDQLKAAMISSPACPTRVGYCRLSTGMGRSRWLAMDSTMSVCILPVAALSRQRTDGWTAHFTTTLTNSPQFRP